MNPEPIDKIKVVFYLSKQPWFSVRTREQQQSYDCFIYAILIELNDFHVHIQQTHLGTEKKENQAAHAVQLDLYKAQNSLYIQRILGKLNNHLSIKNRSSRFITTLHPTQEEYKKPLNISEKSIMSHVVTITLQDLPLFMYLKIWIFELLTRNFLIINTHRIKCIYNWKKFGQDFIKDNT